MGVACRFLIASLNRLQQYQIVPGRRGYFPTKRYQDTPEHKIKVADMAQTSFIEGSLTYYVSSGSAAQDASHSVQTASAESGALIFEGVGVPPSEEFFKTTIPFEDFSTVALALANVNVGPPANVTLSVFSESNQLKGTKSIPLGPHEHSVSFLWEQFPSLTMGSGQLDIESDKAIFGTALTFVQRSVSPAGSLFSSLPMLPTPYAYPFRTPTSGINLEGELSLWANGLVVEGYIRLLKVSGLASSPPETYLLFGEFNAGTLEVAGFGTSHALADQKSGVLAIFDGFGFTKSLQLGYFIMGNPITRAGDEGTINLVRSF
jgi:hypothetical protein